MAPGAARNTGGTAKGGKAVQGLFTSSFGCPVIDLLWLSTRKLQTKRNHDLYIQRMRTFSKHMLLGWFIVCCILLHYFACSCISVGCVPCIFFLKLLNG